MAIFDLLSETEVKIFENNARDVVRARKLLKKSSYTLESNKEFSVIVKKMVKVRKRRLQKTHRGDWIQNA